MQECQCKIIEILLKHKKNMFNVHCRALPIQLQNCVKHHKIFSLNWPKFWQMHLTCFSLYWEIWWPVQKTRRLGLYVRDFWMWQRCWYFSTTESLHAKLKAQLVVINYITYKTICVWKQNLPKFKSIWEILVSLILTLLSSNSADMFFTLYTIHTIAI